MSLKESLLILPALILIRNKLDLQDPVVLQNSLDQPLWTLVSMKATEKLTNRVSCPVLSCKISETDCWIASKVLF